MRCTDYDSAIVIGLPTRVLLNRNLTRRTLFSPGRLDHAVPYAPLCLAETILVFAIQPSPSVLGFGSTATPYMIEVKKRTGGCFQLLDPRLMSGLRYRYVATVRNQLRNMTSRPPRSWVSLTVQDKCGRRYAGNLSWQPSRFLYTLHLLVQCAIQLSFPAVRHAAGRPIRRCCKP